VELAAAISLVAATEQPCSPGMMPGAHARPELGGGKYRGPLVTPLASHFEKCALSAGCAPNLGFALRTGPVHVIGITSQLLVPLHNRDNIEVPRPPPQKKCTNPHMAGCRITPVLVFWTCRDLHWVEFTFETGFELPSSWAALPGYEPNLNRNILDFMK
jgi:hypothetical protein